MKKYVYAAMVGLFIGTVAGLSGASESKTTTKTYPDGSVEVCRYETDFVQTRDGANVIRTAWRCVRYSRSGASIVQHSYAASTGLVSEPALGGK